MKIAQISPLCESLPPRLYGGTERIVASLCDALVELGHDVTLFAAADAQTRARLIPVRDQSIRLDPAPLKSDVAAHLAMLDEVRRRQDAFDILHFHIDLLHFPFFEDNAERTLTDPGQGDVPAVGFDPDRAGGEGDPVPVAALLREPREPGTAAPPGARPGRPASSSRPPPRPRCRRRTPPC